MLFNSQKERKLAFFIVISYNELLINIRKAKPAVKLVRKVMGLLVQIKDRQTANVFTLHFLYLS